MGWEGGVRGKVWNREIILKYSSLFFLFILGGGGGGVGGANVGRFGTGK